MLAVPIYVNAATAPRSRFGIVDAADEVVPEDRVFAGGLEFQPRCRFNATMDPADCLDPTPFDLGEDGDGRPVVTAEPIHLYAGFTCRTVGLEEDTTIAEARAALTNSASPAIERVLWTPAPAPPPGQAQRAMRLMGPDTVVLAGGTPVGLTKGVRLLEDYLSTHYGGVGVLHAPAGVSADIAAAHLVRWDNGRPVTARGTRWSWGAYPYADTAGTPAAADTAWLVATGHITLRRSGVSVLGEYAQMVDRATNEIFAIARQSVVVAWECVTAAVAVSLTT